MIKMLKSKDNIEFIDKKKITISTRKKNNKIYRTYQININQDYIRMLLNDDPITPTETKKINLYLTKKHEQHYVIQEKPNTINNPIKVTANFNDKKKIIQLTLPKNNIPYIKAYDDYLTTIDKLNAENNNTDECFDATPLYASTLFNIGVDDVTISLKMELSITNIKTNIKKEFINYIQEENGGIIPDWLKILITDWNDEYINTIFKIN